MFGNWNRCIELARSEWVFILSDDDLLDRSFVEAMLAVTDRDEAISLLSCRAELMDERSGRLGRFVSLAKREVKRIQGPVHFRSRRPVAGLDVYLDSVSSLGISSGAVTPSMWVDTTTKPFRARTTSSW